jgi:beta-mannosidase
MQDFMYSCAFYPDYLDWFMHEAHLEAEYQTKRLAHHACMAVWTGNNEVHESYTDWFRGDIEPL